MKSELINMRSFRDIDWWTMSREKVTASSVMSNSVVDAGWAYGNFQRKEVYRQSLRSIGCSVNFLHTPQLYFVD